MSSINKDTFTIRSMVAVNKECMYDSSCMTFQHVFKKKKNGPKILVTRMRMRIRMYGDESGSKDFQ